MIESKKPNRRGGSSYFSSVINLVDLAGSEPLVRGINSEKSLFEKNFINKVRAVSHLQSLITLTHVFEALAEGAHDSYIPYRESRLTKYLQPFLEGNARMAVIFNLTAAESSYQEVEQAVKLGEQMHKLRINVKRNEVTDISQCSLHKFLEEQQKLKSEILEIDRGIRYRQAFLNSQRKSAQEQLPYDSQIDIDMQEKIKLEEELKRV